MRPYFGGIGIACRLGGHSAGDLALYRPKGEEEE